jgi:hypothetical protein
MPAQGRPADSPEYEAKQPSLEVLALPNDDHVDVGSAVRMAREVVGVAGCASPKIGVRRGEHDVLRISDPVASASSDRS